MEAGHDLTVQAGAGVGSSFDDAAYVAAGAALGTVDDAWACEMVLKVKEPIASEYGYLRPNLTLFTYLHLAANEPLTQPLIDSDCVSVSYETVQLADGSLPLLAPMSEVAGRMAMLVRAYHLTSSQGGRGVLASEVPGVRPAKVAVIGAVLVATTHADPTYKVENSLLYCVANTQGAVGYTSTVALTNATLPYALAIANHAWAVATAANPALAKGLAVVNGRIVNAPTAQAFPHLPAA